MKFNKAQKRVIMNGYEKAFSTRELVDRFKVVHRELYNLMAIEALSNHGYPKDVQIEKVKGIETFLRPKGSLENFAINLEESEKLTLTEEFSNLAGSLEFFIQDILENISMVNIDIKFKTSPEEYLEENPNVLYFTRLISKYYDENRLKEYLQEDENFIFNNVDAKAMELGFDDLKFARNNYSIKDIKLTKSHSELAEIFINQEVGKNENASNFMKNNFYNQVVKNNYYEANVTFRVSPEESYEQ